MPLPESAKDVYERLETCGFKIHGAWRMEFVEVGLDVDQDATEWIALDDLTMEQWDGLDEAVRELTGGWPSSPINVERQMTMFG